jgi:hypothetical protein
METSSGEGLETFDAWWAVVFISTASLARGFGGTPCATAKIAIPLHRRRDGIMKPKAEGALATGGSSGITRGTANILAQEGAKLDSAVSNVSQVTHLEVAEPC